MVKNNAAFSASPEVQWERVLWKKQPFPDNYVGDSFLRLHKKKPELEFLKAVHGSLSASQELSSCMTLVGIFFGLSEGELKSSSALLLALVITVMVYCLSRSCLLISSYGGDPKQRSLDVLKELQILCFPCFLIWCSAPIIKSLTASVSTDTIHACTIGLLLLHLLLHPYGADVALVNPTMSQNLGLFAAICLASRLDKNKDVFALVIFAITLFSLLPTFRKHCQLKGLRCLGVTFCLGSIAGAAVCLRLFCASLFHVFVVAVTLCNLIVPFLFVYFQDHRQNIYGPWDEAVIEE